MEELKFNAKYLFEFKNFTDWVNNASKRYRPYKYGSLLIAINSDGKACNDGGDFMSSRDKKLFPVKVYKLETATKQIEK